MTAEIRLGTSAFSANGWPGALYPDTLKSPRWHDLYRLELPKREYRRRHEEIP
jgi:hypothetical protein